MDGALDPDDVSRRISASDPAIYSLGQAIGILITESLQMGVKFPTDFCVVHLMTIDTSVPAEWIVVFASEHELPVCNPCKLIFEALHTAMIREQPENEELVTWRRVEA